ncbi:protein naked cuticle homolog [Leptidea sinapis]|uniref:protein naked cuticle homolog n=1 Tax=Leptidea sinapis TaxID=189913 RepID=UPI0021297AF9|nr:protein naked cuticle homolog [Leptidea sinapis]
MTCYETLRASAPAADAPMAHHFVKWWRNKFRNGYKKFSIGTDGDRTDTEELIGRSTSQCSAPPDLLPSEARALLSSPTPTPAQARTPEPCTKRLSPSLHTNNQEQPRLRFEELTCDVELQHPESSKQQPLQFSFTLYDLDGHGRMTKDDIAGIVSTIYESIGKSVTVPHYGSKTIQVRLTVIPENGPTRDQRDKRDAKRRKRREERKMAAPVECVENSEEEQERLSHDDGVSSKSSSTAEKPPPVRPPPVFRQRPHRHQRREHRERKYTKKRSGSLQRRELLEIIQANMEKNHLSFQASRKPNESTVNEKEFPTKYQKHRNRSHTVNEKSSNAFHRVKSDTTGNNYLDLASGVDSHLCRYDRYLHAVICSSARHAHTGYHHKVAPPPAPHVLHPRSRSHELAPQQQPRVLQIIFL